MIEGSSDRVKILLNSDDRTVRMEGVELARVLYSQQLRALALKKLRQQGVRGAEQAAEEIVQDLFVQLVCKAADHVGAGYDATRAKSGWRGYLRGCINRLFANFGSHKSRRKGDRTVPLPEEGGLSESDREAAIKATVLIRMRECLEYFIKLHQETDPLNQQILCELLVPHEPREIAERLGCLLHRVYNVRNRFRKLIQNHPENDFARLEEKA